MVDIGIIILLSHEYVNRRNVADYRSSRVAFSLFFDYIIVDKNA